MSLTHGCCEREPPPVPMLCKKLDGLSSTKGGALWVFDEGQTSRHLWIYKNNCLSSWSQTEHRNKRLMWVWQCYFIQYIPRSLVQSVPQKQKVVHPSGHGEKWVTTGDEQHQEGEGHGMKHPDGQGVGFHVVDGDERFVVLPHKPLTELQADAQAQGQARLHRGGHSRELAGVHSTSLQSLLDHALYVFPVEVLCHRGDDASSPAAVEKDKHIKANPWITSMWRDSSCHTHLRWTSFCEWRDSPRISPVSSSTAAPVSSQLVSMPSTSLEEKALPDEGGPPTVCLHCSSLCALFTREENMLMNLVLNQESKSGWPLLRPNSNLHYEEQTRSGREQQSKSIAQSFRATNQRDVKHGYLFFLWRPAASHVNNSVQLQNPWP